VTKKSFIIYILVLLFFCWVNVKAAEKLEISKFGGLNTSASDFSIAPNEFRICHDVDLSRNGDSTLSPRLGYVAVTRIAGIDSILGIFTMNYRNGNKQMFTVTDSAGVGYGNIYASALNTDNFDLDFGSSIDSYYVAMWKDTAQYILSTSFGTCCPYHSYVPDSIVIYDSFFVAGDTFIVADTIKDTAQFTGMNDNFVSKINALAGLSSYVTAGVGASTTTYYVKEDNAAISVVFRHGFKVFDSTTLVTFGTKYTLQTVTQFTGNISPEQRVSSYWAIQRPTSFAQFNDLAYFVNGQQKGVVWNGDYLSQWPINAPGEPNVIPITDHDNINGEVAYILKYSTDSAGTEIYTRSYSGYWTPRVRVISGSVILKDFPIPALGTDTVFNVKLYRTKTTAGRFTESDSAYLDTTFAMTPSLFATLIYKDTMPDSALSTSDRIQFEGNHLRAKKMTGRRGAGGDTVETRFGAPRFVSADTVGHDSTSTKNVYGGGSSTQVGVSYIVNYTDTANLITGDASWPLSLLRRGGAGLKENAYTFTLPRPHASNHVVKNIWRASLVTAKWDSLHSYQWRRDSSIANDIIRRFNQFGFEMSFTELEPDTVGLIANFRSILRKPYEKWDVTKPGDTVVMEYRLIAQVPDTQTTYTDTLRYDSLLKVPDVFEYNAPPTGLEKIFVVNDQLIGIKDSRAWKSRVGKLTEWELFDFSSFNQDDGDQITMGLPFRGGILIGKNYSAYNWLPDFTTTEITGIPGCVASQSPIKANGAIYYLSNSGIVALTEGQSLIRYHNSELLSRKLSNFTNQTFPNMQKCVGAYVPQNEQLWFCIGDTSYVYDIGTDLWATSSLSFAGTTLYDVDTTVPFIPGRSLYFFQSGDSVIYKFGEGHKNGSGTYVNMVVESGPIFTDAERQQITGVNIWAQPEASYTLVPVQFYDEADTLLSTYILPRVDRRLSFTEVAPNPAVYYRYRLTSLQATFPMTDGGIDRIDFYYLNIPEVKWE
jgi:hypothetical protein